MGVNKVILLGNLGKDPELRYTPQQLAIGTFSLATTERRKDSSGQWTDVTEWHNVVTFGKTAENCSNYLKKGRQAFVEGRIQTRKWQDKEGRDRYTTEIIASSVQFIGGAKGDGAGKYNQSTDTGGSSIEPSVMDSLPSADQLSAPESVSFDDDDIPF